jgi:hypothetical protein
MAQGVRIEGIVTDRATGIPIAGATVSLDNAGVAFGQELATTPADGTWRLTVTNAERHLANVSAPGYQDSSLPLSAASSITEQEHQNHDALLQWETNGDDRRG